MKDFCDLCLTFFAFAVLASPVAALGQVYAPLYAHALVWTLTGQPIGQVWC